MEGHIERHIEEHIELNFGVNGGRLKEQGLYFGGEWRAHRGAHWVVL